jgi:hypothetical protein
MFWHLLKKINEHVFRMRAFCTRTTTSIIQRIPLTFWVWSLTMHQIRGRKTKCTSDIQTPKFRLHAYHSKIKTEFIWKLFDNLNMHVFRDFTYIRRTFSHMVENKNSRQRREWVTVFLTTKILYSTCRLLISGTHGQIILIFG